MHMAILASTVLAPHVKHPPEAAVFMLEPEWKVKKRQRDKVIQFMEAASRASNRPKPEKPKRGRLKSQI